MERYRNLLRLAETARAYPTQSGFWVRTACEAEDGTQFSGGNKENGWEDAFEHGETATISGLSDLTDSKPVALGWYKEGEMTGDDYGRPCGKCRDVMREYAGPELVLLHGNENNFVYAKLRNYLFEEFKRVEAGKIQPYFVWAALKAARGGVEVYLPESLKPKFYGAALVGEDGTVWQGMHYSNAGFDAVTPVLSAVIGWRNSYPVGSISRRHFELKKLVIAGEWAVPDPFYRDRQAILELDEIVRRQTGRDEPLQVEIVRGAFDNNGWARADEAYLTDTEEWLPAPFTAGAFRMDDVIDAQLAQLTGV